MLERTFLNDLKLHELRLNLVTIFVAKKHKEPSLRIEIEQG